MTHAKKIAPKVEEPEALKKALENARSERARAMAKQTVEALTARQKKPFKINHVVGRTKSASSVY
jgi:acyl-CoA thioesterase